MKNIWLLSSIVCVSIHFFSLHASKQVENLIKQIFSRANDSEVISGVKDFLQSDADVDAVDRFGGTALIYAVRSRSKEAVELLLKNEADVDVADNFNRTALMYAAGSGSAEIVELLLKNGGANIDAADKSKQTVLMYAAGSGSEETVELLLKHKAAINNVNNHGHTALIYAARSGSKDIVKLLLKNGADAHAVNYNGYITLKLASREKRTEAIRLLNNYAAFKFIKIDQEFDKEPELKDYLKEEREFTQTIDVPDRIEKLIEAFKKDKAAYWRDKVQDAYNKLVLEDDAEPLRTLLTRDMYERQSLIVKTAHFFKRRKNFLEMQEMQERLELDATLDEKNRLQEIINLEKTIAAKKIQHAFKTYKQKTK